jgi:hypothetical protein
VLLGGSQARLPLQLLIVSFCIVCASCCGATDFFSSVFHLRSVLRPPSLLLPYSFASSLCPFWSVGKTEAVGSMDGTGKKRICA